MKKLLIVRHANANHESTSGDFSRQLSNKGLQEAALMANRLKEQKMHPQHIISSSAPRALKTALIIAETLSLPKPETHESIYTGNKETLLGLIKGFDESHDFIVLVGHNPDVSDLLSLLTGISRDVPTCTMVLVIFAINNWQDITKGSGDMEWYSTPAQL